LATNGLGRKFYQRDLNKAIKKKKTKQTRASRGFIPLPNSTGVISRNSPKLQEMEWMKYCGSVKVYGYALLMNFIVVSMRGCVLLFCVVGGGGVVGLFLGDGVVSAKPWFLGGF